MQQFERLSSKFVLLYFLDTHTVMMIELKIKQIDQETRKL